MRRIVVLGSTGSIGTQTLDVVRQHPDKLKIVGLAVNTRAQDMLAQAKEFGVGHLAVGSEDVAAGESALDLATFAKSFGEDGSLGFGMSAVVDLVRLSEADVVVNALVGAAGLRASYETLKAGKVLALANKESLVVGGDLIMPLAAQVDEARRASGTAPAVGAGGRAHADRLRARGNLPVPARRERARGCQAVGHRIGRAVPRSYARRFA